jgi:very-short-patch-repair endonuclease
MKGRPNPPTPFPKREGGAEQKRLVWHIVRGQRVAEDKLRLAKELRRGMTPEERILWERVRGNGLGFHFRRQQVLFGYIAGFYCHAAGLVVEVDGAVHDEPVESDAHRTEVFRALGIEVIRFRNEEVNGDLAGVLTRIVAEGERRVASLSEPNPPSPFPLREGGDLGDSLRDDRESGEKETPSASTNEGGSPDPAPPPSLRGKGDGGLGSESNASGEEPRE